MESGVYMIFDVVGGSQAIRKRYRMRLYKIQDEALKGTE